MDRANAFLILPTAYVLSRPSVNEMRPSIHLAYTSKSGSAHPDLGAEFDRIRRKLLCKNTSYFSASCKIENFTLYHDIIEIAAIAGVIDPTNYAWLHRSLDCRDAERRTPGNMPLNDR
ncbi:MAG: hypothetical protein AB7G15_18280 [Alphaproteobacteria bacterium]